MLVFCFAWSVAFAVQLSTLCVGDKERLLSSNRCQAGEPSPAAELPRDLCEICLFVMGNQRCPGPGSCDPSAAGYALYY